MKEAIDIAYENIKEGLKEGYGIWAHGFRSPFIAVNINRTLAVNYALTHCGDTESRPNNPAFPFFDADCTNFVAQCWNAAGLSTAYDYYCDGRYANSYNWINVDDFLNYVTTHEIAKVEWSSTSIKPGDIAQFCYKQDDGSEAWLHSVIITGYDSDGGLCYTGHSDARYNKPLSDIYPDKTAITEIRFIVPLYPTYYCG
ncbi:amidase domain-containing protein [Anaerosinus massiliensis]|uniref:amidase domain-containing protein n=1 Tax=Massilibacillus massiliensis TaxID=1806837 RepID=UPI000DA6108B|nr:amidase domain-containing protein [Massilibacillus massiliensis]